MKEKEMQMILDIYQQSFDKKMGISSVPKKRKLEHVNSFLVQVLKNPKVVELIVEEVASKRELENRESGKYSLGNMGH